MAKQVDMQRLLVRQLAKELSESLHDYEGWSGLLRNFDIEEVIERDGNLVLQGTDIKERERELVLAPVAWQKPRTFNMQPRLRRQQKDQPPSRGCP